MPGTLWIEVDDLFEFVAHNRRPSGIQRVAFEIGRALAAEDGNQVRVRFVRYGSVREPVELVPFATISELFERLSQAPQATNRFARPDSGLPPSGAPRRILHHLLSHTKREIRENVLNVARAERDALVAFRALSLSLSRELGARIPRARGAPRHREGSPGFQQVAAPGDVFLVLGSPWYCTDYAAFIDRLRRDKGIRLAVLVHDVMPLQHPEWCARVVVESYRTWFKTVLPLAETIFATCIATARDIEAEAVRAGIHLAAPVRPIPLGTGFTTVAPDAPASPLLPAPGTYALVVSTLEPRKNHLLLLRAWRQLLAELPPSSVPDLVFAGRIGWMAGDLVQQLVNSDWLDGKIRLIEAPSDADIAALYRGALFTLLPSFAEGWGLPVSESLSYGKPCLATDRPSLREAGGTLARYFDPDNLHDALRAIRPLITDPATLAAWGEEVRHGFRPVAWQASAETILAGLGLERGNLHAGGGTA